MSSVPTSSAVSSAPSPSSYTCNSSSLCRRLPVSFVYRSTVISPRRLSTVISPEPSSRLLRRRLRISYLRRHLLLPPRHSFVLVYSAVDTPLSSTCNLSTPSSTSEPSSFPDLVSSSRQLLHRLRRILLYCALFSTPSSGITYLTTVVYSTVDIILSFARSTI